jgi:xanthosine utilization system XapX-like protein
VIPYLDFANCELGILAGIPLEGGRLNPVCRIAFQTSAKASRNLPLPTQLVDYSVTIHRQPEGAMKFAKHLGPVGPHTALLHVRRNDPPPITHPGFFYGFLGVALAWQVAFIFIATNPARYRPLMIPSVLEKATYGAAVVTLVSQGRMHRSDLVFAGTDLLLGLLFVIAYFKTPTPPVVAQ